MDSGEPTQPVTEIVAPAPKRTESTIPPLILEIKSPTHDPCELTAEFKITGAVFELPGIKRYDGENITLSYNGKDIDPNDCARLDAPLSDINLSMNFVGTATITVQNVSEDQINAIDDHKCVTVPTQTIKDTIDDYFKPNSSNGFDF